MPRRPPLAGRPFSTLAEIAELATTGVGFYLRAGEPLIASAAQKVAFAAWSAADDPAGMAALAGEADNALRAMNDVCCAGGLRSFLTDVLSYLEDAGIRPARELQLEMDLG